MQYKIEKFLIAFLIFLLGFIFGLFFINNQIFFIFSNLIYFLAFFLPFSFIVFGIYSIISGKTYGRSWEKYWGGWIKKEENPFYYWMYSLMYIIAGIMALLGCYFSLLK
jgi:hypothetical protein